MNRQLHLAAYDIRDERRRASALKLLRGYATGGQKSVHEAWLTAADVRDVMARMKALLEPEDRFLLVRLDPRTRTLTAGRGQAPADPGHFYFG